MTKHSKPRRVKAVILPLHDKVTALPVTAIPFTSADEPWESVKLPMWQIPRTAAAYDAMVEQGAAAIRSVIDVGNDGADNSIDPPLSEHAMIAVLRAIGITRPKEDKP